MRDTTPGRRSAHQSHAAFDTTTVLAVLVPIVTVLAVLLVRPEEAAVVDRHPTRTSLTSASIVCPSALPGASSASLTTAEKGVRGTVRVTNGSGAAEERIAFGAVTRVDRGTGPLTVTGEGELAPGLVGARFGSRQVAAVACPAPSPDQWFTGIGAGPSRNSVVELVNPDAGPAVADVTVHGGAGVLDVPRLRGVAVPGRSSVRLDLGSIVPRRGDLALHVVTQRGRLATSVVASYDALGAARPSAEWLPGQPEPARHNVLMGFAPGDGTRTLVVANDGGDEVRATVRFISRESVFAPRGIAELRVPPGGVQRVGITAALEAALRRGTIGVDLTSSGPVAASLLSYVDGDLSHAVSGTPVTTGATVLVPEGRKQVVLGGVDSVGVVTVESRSAGGKVLARTRAALRPGRGAAVKVPDGAVLVSVLPERASVTGSVLVSGTGDAVVPLTPLVRSGLVPDVRPGLPSAG
jgi:hypothetical protein